jgi:hypothetical protein
VTAPKIDHLLTAMKNGTGSTLLSTQLKIALKLCTDSLKSRGYFASHDPIRSHQLMLFATIHMHLPWMSAVVDSTGDLSHKESYCAKQASDEIPIDEGPLLAELILNPKQTAVRRQPE